VKIDEEWALAMRAAVITAMPHQLRQLFCTILISNKPLNAPDLWEEFYLDMADDLF
jgi:hypothetical protein